MAKLRPYRLKLRPARRRLLNLKFDFNLKPSLSGSELYLNGQKIGGVVDLKYSFNPRQDLQVWRDEVRMITPADIDRLRAAMRPVSEALRLMATTLRCLPPAWLERVRAQQDELAAQAQRAEAELEHQHQAAGRRLYLEGLVHRASFVVPAPPVLAWVP